ncbi:hypothetical protein [Floridanema evergladense]|uniref:SPOR domain-containing protein n=1 Tax=Floridaenema evergladense BLCC-F167 TaxID=3153639 RepID=A0ABV4WPM9_9CYAN
MKENQRGKFWSFGKLKWSNFSALLSVLALLMGGFWAVVNEGKAEARHKTRPFEECCVVAQTFPPGFEDEAPFPDNYRFGDRTYEVLVPTYSPDLLNFVQTRIDGRAQVTNRRGRRVITLGNYNLDGARQRVRRLTQAGITAELVATNRFSGSSVSPWENSRYVVYVSVRRRSELEDALWRIQAVVPQAYVWQYQGRNVILVGQFNDQSEALEVRNELRRQGIWAQFSRNSVRPGIPPVSNNETNFIIVENPRVSRVVVRENQVQRKSNFNTSNSYSVVIPARPEELAAIEAQVKQMAIDLGVENEILIQYDDNLPQLIVGPFPQLAAAQEWQSYLQEYGVANSRVINR